MTAKQPDSIQTASPTDISTATVYHTSSEESGSDIDEPYSVAHGLNESDRRVLNEVDEEECLLKGPGISTLAVKKDLESKSSVARRKQRNERRAGRIKKDVDGTGSSGLLYEMEEGYKDSSSRSSSQSRILLDEKWNQKPQLQNAITRLMLIGAGITAIIFLLTYGSYSASKQKHSARLLSNGSHVFGPTTILISLDGFRADFLHRGLTPTMRALIESGTSPMYMLPSFPSLTFPNHFTLVTGLYPESHGIVSNQFWDPALKEEFYYTNVSSSMQPKWWNAEPIWVTAQKSGLKTAIHMWPGSEAHVGNLDPTYLDKYNGSEVLDVKVARILQWLDKPNQDRPQFISAYVPNVDTDGHKYGPNSTEIRATIAEVDEMLTGLIEGLVERNLTEVVNLIVVSDHGMATISNDRLIQLDDFVDLSLIDHIDGWPLQGLRLKNPTRDVPILYEQLVAASQTNEFNVYTRDTMPERYHFGANDRIAPLWVIPHTGWAVVTKKDFDIDQAKLSGQQYEPIGLHGYDHEHPLMRAIFIARGPAFPHPPNSRITPFQNIEVYNIVCDSLGLKPHPNNGTLRLPFTTEGLHSDLHDTDATPADPVDSIVQDTSQSTSIAVETIEDDVIRPATIIPEPTKTSIDTVNNFAPKPTGTFDKSPETAEQSHSSWWDFIHNQINEVKQWAKEFIDSIRENKPSQDQSMK